MLECVWFELIDPKSVRGALVMQKGNPAVNIKTLQAKVGAYSEDCFNDLF